VARTMVIGHDAVNYQQRPTSRSSASQPTTHVLAGTGVHLFNAGASIIISRRASIVEFYKLLIHHETRTYLSQVDVHVPNVETELPSECRKQT